MEIPEGAWLREGCVSCPPQGLFRIAAGASKLKKLKAALDCSSSHLDEFYSDPHAVAGKWTPKEETRLFFMALPQAWRDSESTGESWGRGGERPLVAILFCWFQDWPQLRSSPLVAFLHKFLPHLLGLFQNISASSPKSQINILGGPLGSVILLYVWPEA